MRFLRFLKIFFTIVRFGLDELVLSGIDDRRVRFLMRITTFGRKFEIPRGIRLRLALESLGPIFVKFGQVLSTRRDLLPVDIADELAKLQDQVPPFDSALAVEIVEKSLGAPVDVLFDDFERVPVASASIAQVHFAKMRTGGTRQGRRGEGAAARHAARDRFGPGAAARHRDLGRASVGGRQAPEAARSRRRIRQVSARRARPDARGGERQPVAPQFRGLDLLLVPEMYWDFCAPTVLVMERMRRRADQSDRGAARRGRGHPEAGARRRRDFLHAGVPRRFLPRRHAPRQHSGSLDPAHSAAISRSTSASSGALSGLRQELSRAELPRVLQRDYHRVATLHLESGWVPPNTRVEELESAIRAVCEPYFDRR